MLTENSYLQVGMLPRELQIGPPGTTEFEELWNLHEQIDYFIKTYSNEGILDLTCCNGMVGDRCEKLNRNYIGIDIEFREGEPNHDNKKGISPLYIIYNFIYNRFLSNIHYRFRILPYIITFSYNRGKFIAHVDI